MNRFENKTVLVTGAAGGIGSVTAQQFALEGAQVVATDINMEKLQETFKEDIANGLKIETIHQDVTIKKDWEELVDDIVARHGHLDILFNNAGGGEFASCEDTSEERWRWVNAMNVDSVFSACRRASA